MYLGCVFDNDEVKFLPCVSFLKRAANNANERRLIARLFVSTGEEHGASAIASKGVPFYQECRGSGAIKGSNTPCVNYRGVLIPLKPTRITYEEHFSSNYLAQCSRS